LVCSASVIIIGATGVEDNQRDGFARSEDILNLVEN
jgi:hypothetical protein